MSVTGSNVKSYIHAETSVMKEKRNDKYNKINFHDDFYTVHSSQLSVPGLFFALLLGQFFLMWHGCWQR